MGRRIRSLTLALVAAAALFALPAAGQPQSPDEIAIAVAGPMSGRFARYGAEMRAGAEKAVHDLNGSGGVLGRSLKLTVADDGCNREQAVGAARRIAGSGVRLVVGHFCASASLAAAPVYAEAGVIHVSPAGLTLPQEWRDARPVLFRMTSEALPQGEIAGRFLAARHPGRRIAILHDRTVYGRTFADDALEALRAAGQQEAGFAFIRPGEKDYSAAIDALKSASIDILVFGGYATEAALLVRQMRARGLQSVILAGGDALAEKDYWAIAGEAAEGSLVVFRRDASRHPAASGVVRRLRMSGIEATGYVLHAYAAVEAWAQAATAAGSLSGDAVTSMLLARPARTVLGEVSFDNRGESVLPSYSIHAWKSGALAPVD